MSAMNEVKAEMGVVLARKRLEAAIDGPEEETGTIPDAIDGLIHATAKAALLHQEDLMSEDGPEAEG